MLILISILLFLILFFVAPDFVISIFCLIGFVAMALLSIGFVGGVAYLISRLIVAL